MLTTYYDEVEPFENGVAVVRSGDYYGLIGSAGNIIIPVEFDSLYAFKTGWVQAKKKDTEYLYTTDGNEVLQLSGLIYWYTPYEDIIRAKKSTGWGTLNLQGETMIPFQYISLGPCCNGWLSFYEDGKWGWLNKQGDVVVPAAHAEVGVWSAGLWWSRNKDGYRLYNYSGQIVRDEGWEKILPPANGVAAVKTAAGWKFIDEAFNAVLQLKPGYDWVEYFSEGLAAVKQAGAWGFIDPNGKEVITPFYHNVSMFREGLAAVQIDERWGFIDTAGTIVIPASYHTVGSFHKGRALVRDVWCEWYIDREGRDVSERKYSD